MNQPDTNHPNPPGTRRRFAMKVPTFAGLLPHSAAWFLFALILLFVTAPFVQELDAGRVIESLLITVVLCAAVFAVGGRRATLTVAVLLATPAIIGRWVFHYWPLPQIQAFFVFCFLVFVVFVVAQFLRFMLRARRVNSEVLCAAISTYLLLGLLWATAYILVARMMPGSFAGLPTEKQPLQGFDALYFSVITLTTVGYGDLAPVSGPARMLAMMEAFTGTMYVAVLVARLVSVYSVEASEAAGKE